MKNFDKSKFFLEAIFFTSIHIIIILHVEEAGQF